MDKMFGFMLGFGFTVVVFLVMGTQFNGYFQTVTQRVVVATTTVSIIAEKQECDKKGGNFVVEGVDVFSPNVIYRSDAPALEIICTGDSSPTTYFDITTQ